MRASLSRNAMNRFVRVPLVAGAALALASSLAWAAGPQEGPRYQRSNAPGGARIVRSPEYMAAAESRLRQPPEPIAAPSPEAKTSVQPEPVYPQEGGDWDAAMHGEGVYEDGFCDEPCFDGPCRNGMW